MKATKAAEFARMVGRRAAKRAMRQASYRRGLLAADIGVKKDHTDELAQGAAAAPALAKGMVQYSLLSQPPSLCVGRVT